MENVLGEIGRGHIIAFNILNLGRLKLGPFCVGGAKDVLAASIKYAKERKAFGTTISQFGLIQSKLAEMAIRIYAAESVSYRVVGQIEALLDGFDWSKPGAPQVMMKAVEEFAAECSIVKVQGSEMLDYVVDEGVQIHGGYGFHQDYAVERAYRDSRINRIFEGTNEINRLLIPGILLKRAAKGALPLVAAAQGVLGEVLGGSRASEPGGDLELARNAKKVALLLMGVAYQKYLAAIEQQQEILAGIADVVMEAFAMESVALRAAKQKGAQAVDISRVLACDALGRIEIAGRSVLAACSEGDGLRANLALLRRFTKYEPVDAIGLRRQIAGRLLDAGKYV